MAGYIESIQVSVLLFPIIGLLLFIPLSWAHYKRFGELHEYRAFVSYLCTFAFVAAMMLTVLPLPHDTQPQCNWTDKISRSQLVPFMSFYDVWSYEQRQSLGWTLSGLLANKALWQLVLNTLLLLPLGFLFRALYGIGLKTSILLAFLTSLVLETTQLTGIWGLANCPYRIFDVDDLITNTLGASLGWMLYSLFRWLPDPRAPEDNLWYRRHKKK